MYLAAEYGKKSGEFGEILMHKAETWPKLRQEKESDKQADKAWDAMIEGRLETTLRLDLKMLEKLQRPAHRCAQAGGAACGQANLGLHPESTGCPAVTPAMIGRRVCCEFSGHGKAGGRAIRHCAAGLHAPRICSRRPRK
jgi:hypothetical protein